MLIVAGGSKYSYFGHPEWAEYAPEIKSLERALDVRYRILRAFEAAELETDHERRAEWLTFVVVGAGPTGVEMAGQIAELARDTLPRDYRAIDTGRGPDPARRGGRPRARRLPARPVRERGAPARQPRRDLAGRRDGRGHRRGRRRAQGARRHDAAGRRAHRRVGRGRRRGERRRAPGGGRRRGDRPRRPRDGRARPHAAGAPRGDRARRHGARALAGRRGPGPARASRPSRCSRAATRRRSCSRRLAGKPVKPFRYIDKGNLATIGRARAVAEIKGLHFGGPFAWLLWLGIHIFYLIGFQNRILVLTRWAFSFLTRGRGARLMTGEAATGASGGGVHTPGVEVPGLKPGRVGASIA